MGLREEYEVAKKEAIAKYEAGLKELKEIIPELEETAERLRQGHTGDPVNHPAHYETGKFECIEVMEEVFGADAVKDFCICNAFKYLYRHKRKNGTEDLKKARWCLDRAIRTEEGMGTDAVD